MSFHPQMQYAPAAWHRSQRKLAEEGPPFAYTPETLATFQELVTHYPPDRRKSVVIYALFLVQQQQGWVSRRAMQYVAGQIGCTAEEVEDVFSYYAMFFGQPVGRYVLQVCRTLPCALRGAERVTEAIATHLGIGLGETDPTGTFTLMEAECLGACDRAPVIMVNDDWQECQRPEQVGQLLEGLRTRGLAALTGCHHVVEK